MEVRHQWNYVEPFCRELLSSTFSRDSELSDSNSKQLWAVSFSHGFQVYSELSGKPFLPGILPLQVWRRTISSLSPSSQVFPAFHTWLWEVSIMLSTRTGQLSEKYQVWANQHLCSGVWVEKKSTCVAKLPFPVSLNWHIFQTSTNFLLLVNIYFIFIKMSEI